MHDSLMMILFPIKVPLLNHRLLCYYEIADEESLSIVYIEQASAVTGAT